ncbi:hypothetical protein GF402_08105 [Candidatus Fermentibacteria bacterium]|nr:hypothetical protein [Candidatus Fermentibacteria bacterium]
MSSRIYWFSGSGNSLKLAKEIAEDIDAELVPMASTKEVSLEGLDVVGMVFPVYAWGPPRLVERFAEGLDAPESGKPYVFAAITSGGAPGPSLSTTEKLLAHGGIKLDAGFAVRMPSNYPGFGGLPSLEKRRKKIASAEETIARIVDGVKSRQKGIWEDTPAIIRFFGRLGGPLHRGFVRSLEKAADKYGADEKCTGCGVCARICPTGNVTLVSGRPEWGNRCEACFACFHWCPEDAVQYGDKTTDEIRYHHPDVTLEEMMAMGKEEG